MNETNDMENQYSQETLEQPEEEKVKDTAQQYGTDSNDSEPEIKNYVSNIEKPTLEESVRDNPMSQESVPKEPVLEDPVQEELIIEEPVREESSQKRPDIINR